MNISYRLKKKELILLLDLFGDAEKLEQNFGNVYIDRDEYTVLSEALHRKGFVTLSGNSISAEGVISFMMETVYSAPLVFADEKSECWIYCTPEIMIYIRVNTAGGLEYLLSAVSDAEDRDMLTENISDRQFRIIRGGSGNTDGADLVSFAEAYEYEK